jgi:ferric-dicitrate binding protein FerR (iron transport regulator)
MGMILMVAIWALVPSHPFADYRTSKGETRTIRLADGSTVELSTNTALSLGFTERTRRISLLSGTAFFQVAPDRTRLFMVDAAGGETTALGTAFAVGHQNDDGVQVIDTEHSVSVRVVQQMIHLSAGDQITYRKGHLETLERSDSATALAWRDGRRGRGLSRVRDQIGDFALVVCAIAIADVITPSSDLCTMRSRRLHRQRQRDGCTDRDR